MQMALKLRSECLSAVVDFLHAPSDLVVTHVDAQRREVTAAIPIQHVLEHCREKK